MTKRTFLGVLPLVVSCAALSGENDLHEAPLDASPSGGDGSADSADAGDARDASTEARDAAANDAANEGAPLGDASADVPGAADAHDAALDVRDASADTQVPHDAAVDTTVDEPPPPVTHTLSVTRTLASGTSGTVAIDSPVGTSTSDCGNSCSYSYPENTP